nr:unnamed protein product [Digitaria exilis]
MKSSTSSNTPMTSPVATKSSTTSSQKEAGEGRHNEVEAGRAEERSRTGRASPARERSREPRSGFNGGGEDA